jgi:hypothetical protein
MPGVSGRGIFKRFGNFGRAREERGILFALFLNMDGEFECIREEAHMSAIQKYKQQAQTLQEKVTKLEEEVAFLRERLQGGNLVTHALYALCFAGIEDYAANEKLIRSIPKLESWLSDQSSLKLTYETSVSILKKEFRQISVTQTLSESLEKILRES